MTPREIENRLNGIIACLHLSANPPHKATVGQLKSWIRQARDQLREIVREMGGDPP